MKPNGPRIWIGVGIALILAGALGLAGATAVLAQTPPTWRMMGGQTDRHFIEMMVPHHDDAIAMAELALAQAEHPEIRALAETIRRGIELAKADGAAALDQAGDVAVILRSAPDELSDLHEVSCSG